MVIVARSPLILIDSGASLQWGDPTKMAATRDYVPARHEASTYIMSMGHRPHRQLVCLKVETLHVSAAGSVINMFLITHSPSPVNHNHSSYDPSSPIRGLRSHTETHCSAHHIIIDYWSLSKTISNWANWYISDGSIWANRLSLQSDKLTSLRQTNM